MSEEQSVNTAPARRGAPGITGAVILIAVGIVVLLSNLNMLTVDWLSLLRFWPVILVLVGLDIILGRHSALGSLAVAAIAVVMIGGIIWIVGVTGQWALPASGNIVTTEIAETLGDVSSLEVHLNVGVMETKVVALSGSKQAARGSYKTSSETLKIDVNYETRGDIGVLTVSQQGRDQRLNLGANATNKLDLALTDQLPVDLIIDAGVGKVNLDLTGINLHSLRVKAGVGTVDITLPERGTFEVNIDAGVGSVDVIVPKSLEARVQYDGGLSDLDVSNRFEKTGENVWETDKFSGATNQVTISVHAGIGDVNIKD